MSQIKLLRRVTRFDLIALSVLFVSSLIIRLVFVSNLHGAVVTSDGKLYINIAIHFLQGEGFIQDIRSNFIVMPPLYPCFLAFIYKAFGIGNMSAVSITQALLGASTVVFIYITAKELFTRWAGLFSGLLFSIYSVSIYWTGYVLTETLFTFFVIAFTYALTRLLRVRASYWTAGLVGLIWGISCLIRPHLLLFIIFFWIILFIIRGKQGIQLAVVSTLVLLVVVASWIGHLYFKYDAIIPISSYGGLSLWLGNNQFTNPNEYLTRTLYADIPWLSQKISKARNRPPGKQDQFYRNMARQFIASQPLKFVDNTFKKKILFWKPVNPPLEIFLHRLGQVLNQTDRWILVLALPGFFLSFLPKWDFKRNQILLWLILYYSLLVSVNNIVALGRFRLPIMPLVVIYGGLAISVFLRGLIKGAKLSVQFVQNIHPHH